MTGDYEFDIEVCQGECGTDLRDPESQRIHSYPFVSIRTNFVCLCAFLLTNVVDVSAGSPVSTAIGHSQAQAHGFC